MGMAALGAAIIGGGVALTHKNPYSGKDVKGSVGLTPSSPLSPNPPPVMPDQAMLQQEQTLQESKDAALRYGRASTVLTNTGAANTTGEKLGP